MSNSIQSDDVNTPLCGSGGRISDDASSIGAVAMKASPFYDSLATLDIHPDIARGFLILLTNGAIDEETSNAGESSSQLEEDEEKNELAFLAITDGNIVDACFGVEKRVKKRFSSKKSPAQESSRKCKEALREAAEINESIRSLAIEAYSECFRVVIKFDKDVRALGMVTWCMKHCTITSNAVKRLEEVFKLLDESMSTAL
mmetsp:Transcript_12412/g.18132  ORF Transcript_12412/g.18132 Transcript_12412/m.18132 type:complete len:201 (-) Transcript_12412:376-978(-)